MPAATKNREFAFILNDVARLLRTYADYKAAQFGMTRAQWAVLSRVDRAEGLNQAELAEVLDLQPITLSVIRDSRSDGPTSFLQVRSIKLGMDFLATTLIAILLGLLSALPTRPTMD